MRNNEIKIEKYMNRVKVRIIIRVCHGKENQYENTVEMEKDDKLK
jgi:hypothetical protein